MESSHTYALTGALSSVSFEPLTEADLPDVLAVYNHYILHSTATYHIAPITLDRMRGITDPARARFRSFSIRENGALIGYFGLEPFSDREGFDRTAEVTLYLAPGHTGRGIGCEAVRFLEEAARREGLHTLVAAITGENEASQTLFRRCGWEMCGLIRDAGFKFGRWLDLVYYEKLLPAE